MVLFPFLSLQSLFDLFLFLKILVLSTLTTISNICRSKTMHIPQILRTLLIPNSRHLLFKELLFKGSDLLGGSMGLIPGSGRFPGGANGNPLQYSCQDNQMDGEAWQSVRQGWITEQVCPLIQGFSWARFNRKHYTLSVLPLPWELR